jgi:hypothetical protein
MTVEMNAVEGCKINNEDALKNYVAIVAGLCDHFFEAQD